MWGRDEEERWGVDPKWDGGSQSGATVPLPVLRALRGTRVTQAKHHGLSLPCAPRLSEMEVCCPSQSCSLPLSLLSLLPSIHPCILSSVHSSLCTLLTSDQILILLTYTLRTALSWGSEGKRGWGCFKAGTQDRVQAPALGSFRVPSAACGPPCHWPGSLGKASEVSTHAGWLCLSKESGGGLEGQ